MCLCNLYGSSDMFHKEGALVRSQNIIGSYALIPNVHIVHGVPLCPVLASRKRDVFAAQLCLNGLYGGSTNSFPVECVIVCPGSFPYYFYKFLHMFIGLLHRTVFEPFARLFLTLLHHRYSTLICLHNCELFQLVMFMCSIPEQNPYVISYLTSMCAMRNMMHRHHYRAHLSFFSVRSHVLHSDLQQHLFNQNSQSSRLLVMYHLRCRLPPQCSLSWLFLALDLISLCESWLPDFAWLSPSVHTSADIEPGFLPHPPMRAFAHGSGTQREIPFDAIEPYVVTGCNINDKNAFVFVDHVDNAGLLLYPTDKHFVHANVPLRDMVSYLPVKMFLKIARLHHIAVGSHVPKSEFGCYVEAHDCVSCNLYLSVFSVIDSKSVKARNRMQAMRLDLNKLPSEPKPLKSCASESFHKTVSDIEPFQSKPANTLENRARPEVIFSEDSVFEPTEFPPHPPDDKLSHKIISDFCAKTTSSSIEEAGCAACRQLVPISQLSRLKAMKNLLPILQVPNVTRIERSKNSQPICEYKGPILDFTCNRICDGCCQYLQNGKILPHALANGLWLGTVPEELSCPGFVENLWVACVQINSCFVRVASSGLRKMVSHVIAFESPVPKVYHRLPPPMEDLDEVLAILFTGPCKPTDKEFQCTPLLVRQKEVARVLEWLKLNHADYADL